MTPREAVLRATDEAQAARVDEMDRLALAVARGLARITLELDRKEVEELRREGRVVEVNCLKFFEVFREYVKDKQDILKL